MGTAKDVLKELESIGAVGGEEPIKLTVEQVAFIERDAPSVVPHGPGLAEELEELAASLRGIALSMEGAAETCERLASAWSHVDAAEHGEVLTLGSPPTELRAVPPRTETIPPSHVPSTLTPADLEAARELARRKIRGEHLSDAERTELLGEAAVTREDPDAPAISLPALTPSYPPEEIKDGQVPEKG